MPPKMRAAAPIRLTEEQFLQQVRTLARLTGWITYHTRYSKGSDHGFPDLVLVHPRRKLIVYAELKTDRGRTTARQELWLNSLRDAGAEAHLWRPADLDTIKTLLTGRPATDANAEA